jgi:protein-L-isoaspartate(D-aspartate) O-methyltransferase
VRDDDEDDLGARRRAMVDEQIQARGIRDPALLAAMREVPRHEFVAATLRRNAYEDTPLPIEERQTISQPYIVALMTELARLESTSRVLELGTGCGYQTAVLAACAAEVFTIEIDPVLAEQAARTLDALGIVNVKRRVGDGSFGWPEAAPFDAIVVTAAPPDVPPALIDQLVVGGRLVIPLGTDSQSLWRFTREAYGIRPESILPVRFVLLR